MRFDGETEAVSGPGLPEAMWFGPKGFASVVYALLVLQSGIRRRTSCSTSSR